MTIEQCYAALAWYEQEMRKELAKDNPSFRTMHELRSYKIQILEVLVEVQSSKLAWYLQYSIAS